MSRSSRPRDVRRSLARRVPRPPLEGHHRLSLVIPAYREAGCIGSTIERIRSELGEVLGHDGLEVVVVDDGSDDGTASEAREAGADHVVVLPENRGKGAAVRAAIPVATGAVVAFTDADLAYAPGHVLLVLEAVEEGWDVAIGSRRHPDASPAASAGRLRDLGSRGVNAATRAVLAGGYVDTQCGLKAFRADIAAVLFGQARIDGFAFDIELLALAELYGFSVSEVPVVAERSETSTVNVARDALVLLADIGRMRRWRRTSAYDPAPAGLRHLGRGGDG